MVHPGTDNFWRRGLGCRREPFYLGVYFVMRTIKLLAAALLVAAVAAVPGPVFTEKREHLLQGDTITIKREHLLY